MKMIRYGAGIDQIMLFIINPVSASGETLKEWESARRALESTSLAFVERMTTRAGEATEIARSAFSCGYESVIAVGGDGTLNEVVNGYFDERGNVINPSAAIGLLPSGTGSDFRRSIGLTTSHRSLSALFSGARRSIDIARVALKDSRGEPVNRYLINVASFGLGGETVALVNSWRGRAPKFIGGRLRFTAAALLALKRYRSSTVTVRLDEERVSMIRTGFFVVANGRFAGGGMMFAPEAELNDGLLDVILTDEITRIDIIRELPRIQRGEHLRNPKVSVARASVVEIESDIPLAVDIDGEFAGYTPSRLTVLPSALRFIA